MKEERVNYDILPAHRLFTKTGDRNVDTHSDVKIFEVVKADTRLAATLAIGEDDKVWHVKRVRFIKQKPVKRRNLDAAGAPTSGSDGKVEIPLR